VTLIMSEILLGWPWRTTGKMDDKFHWYPITGHNSCFICAAKYWEYFFPVSHIWIHYNSSIFWDIQEESVCISNITYFDSFSTAACKCCSHFFNLFPLLASPAFCSHRRVQKKKSMKLSPDMVAAQMSL